MEGQTHFMWQKDMAQTSDAEGTSKGSLLPYSENSRRRALNFLGVFLVCTQKIIDEDSLVSYFPSHDTMQKAFSFASQKSKSRAKLEAPYIPTWTASPSRPDSVASNDGPWPLKREKELKRCAMYLQ